MSDTQGTTRAPEGATDTGRPVYAGPIDPVMPDNTVTIEPIHVVVTSKYDSGSAHAVHMIENPDLGLLPGRTENWADPLPRGETATIVVTLGVDGGFDQVQFDHGIETDECLAQAIEALMLCRNANASLTGGRQVSLAGARS